MADSPPFTDLLTSSPDYQRFVDLGGEFEVELDGKWMVWVYRLFLGGLLGELSIDVTSLLMFKGDPERLVYEQVQAAMQSLRDRRLG